MFCIRRFLSFAEVLSVWFLLLALASCSPNPSEPAARPALPSDQPKIPESGEASASSGGREFSLMVYNVENLFDLDGVAVFDDYQKKVYSMDAFLTKLRNITAVIAHVNGGRGPDILAIQELEGDQTPGDWSGDASAVLNELRGRTVEEVLTSGDPAAAARLRGLPSYVWLLKALDDAGLAYPHVAVADYQPYHITVDGPVHVNAVFSRLPITASRSHALVKARAVLEVELDVDGHPFRIFNNHWKSGASDPKTEPLRVGNARVLRERLNAILADDPAADFVVVGDLNSHYNHAALFPDLPETGINDVLGSQGDETALRIPGGADLYDLWYELPFEQRGSELYRARWGTLMHIIISRGLHDFKGVQYRDNQFEVVAIKGLNCQPLTGGPLAWGDVEGGGFSDHFPILARFRSVADGDASRFIDLDQPHREAGGPDRQPVFDYAALANQTWPKWTGNPAGRESELGKLFRIKAKVIGEKPFVMDVDGHEFTIWSPQLSLRKRIYAAAPVGTNLEFIGEFGRHRENWQFVIQDASWFINPALDAPSR